MGKTDTIESLESLGAPFFLNKEMGAVVQGYQK